MSDEKEYTLESGVGRLQDNAAGLKGCCSKFWTKGSDVACETLDTVRDITADIPLLAVLGTAFLGFVTTLILRRR